MSPREQVAMAKPMEDFKTASFFVIVNAAANVTVAISVATSKRVTLPFPISRSESLFSSDMTQDEVRGEIGMTSRLERNTEMHTRIVSYSTLILIIRIKADCTNSNVQYYGLYVHLANETKLLVDTSRRKTIRINFEVTFPVVACSILNLDAVDINEKQHLDVKHDIVKKRVDAHDNVIEMRLDRIGILKIEKLLQRHGGKLKHNETWCGSCYGSKEVDDQCYNSCEDICDAYRNKSWSFSNSVMNNQCTRDSFLQKIMGEASEGCDIYGSLEVIKVAENFHFALGKSFKESKVFFFYDLPPIKVTFKEHDISFLQFLTNVCAIVGGVFTITGIIDLYIYHGGVCVTIILVMDLGWMSSNYSISMACATSNLFILNAADRVIRGGANMIFWGDIGNIYLSQLSGTHSYFAIKAMNKASLASDKKLSRAQIEKEILQLLDHPLLPTLYAHSETDRFSCLVIKYSPRGDLHTSRQQQPGKYFFEYARTFKLDDELVEKFGDIHGREFGIEMDSLDAMIIRVNNFEANYAFNRIKKENRE
ncbi:hypothetical protein V6N11_045924 [Hibiscus sabdariffa]|uniref:Protein kinase domain-containing protein n=1 Tax=Hibiscus sabdariffa TaxID=183260 RepID=A0ABR2Q2D6_9ROSI